MPSRNKSYEIRGIVEWVDGEDTRREVIMRDMENHQYEYISVSAGANPVQQAGKKLGIGSDQITLPEHVKRGLERWTG